MKQVLTHSAPYTYDFHIELILRYGQILGNSVFIRVLKATEA